MTRLSTLLLLVAALAGACTNVDEADVPVSASSSPPSSSVAAAPPPALQTIPCADGGACPAGFVLQELTFLIDCTAISDNSLETGSLESGSLQGRAIEVRGIVGIDPSSFVAVSWPGASPCPAGWNLAIEQHVQQQQLDDALCSIGAETNC